MLEEENEVIQLTSKGASMMGLVMIKELMKELELTKRRFLSLQSLVKRLDQKEADRILLFAAKEGLGPFVGPIHEALLTINDNFLEPLREGLIHKKVKTWEEAVALFETPRKDEDNIQNFISNMKYV